MRGRRKNFASKMDAQKAADEAEKKAKQEAAEEAAAAAAAKEDDLTDEDGDITAEYFSGSKKSAPRKPSKPRQLEFLKNKKMQAHKVCRGSTN